VSLARMGDNSDVYVFKADEYICLWCRFGGEFHAGRFRMMLHQLRHRLAGHRVEAHVFWGLLWPSRWGT
jgi:hypothetical protein